MKLSASSAMFVLLLAVAALTVTALPRGMEADAAITGSTSHNAQMEISTSNLVNAPVSTFNYNDIAMVLEMSSVADAASLASYAGSYVLNVLRFNAVTQSFQVYTPGNPGSNFPLGTGDFVFLLVNGQAPSSLALVGDVPDEGSVTFALESGTPPKYNFISLPLDRSDLTTASAVASEIGTSVQMVLRFQSDTQSFQVYVPGNPGSDFNLSIGEPFILLLGAGAPARWP